MVNTASKYSQTAEEASDSLTGKITTPGLGLVTLTNGGSQSILISGTLKTSSLSLLETRPDGSITNVKH